MATTTMRMDWRELFEEVCSENGVFAILNRGRPEAVLLSEARWAQGRGIIPVMDSDLRLRASSDARACLRAVRATAYKLGQHTLIRQLYGPLFRNGTADRVTAVIAPYEWVLHALPELGPVVRESTQTW